MNKRKIVASLNEIANDFDLLGMTKEADKITKIMVKLSQDLSDYESYLNSEQMLQHFRKWAYENTRYNYETRLNPSELAQIDESLDYVDEEAGHGELFIDEDFANRTSRAIEELGKDRVKELIVSKIEDAMSEVETFENEDERGNDESFYGQDMGGDYGDDYEGDVADFPSRDYPY